jgi:hypothetical protein
MLVQSIRISHKKLPNLNSKPSILRQAQDDSRGGKKDEKYLIPNKSINGKVKKCRWPS